MKKKREEKKAYVKPALVKQGKLTGIVTGS